MRLNSFFSDGEKSVIPDTVHVNVIHEFRKIKKGTMLMMLLEGRIEKQYRDIMIRKLPHTGKIGAKITIKKVGDFWAVYVAADPNKEYEECELIEYDSTVSWD